MYIRLFLIIVVSLLVSGCPTIPAEAPQLSEELGKRIVAIEKAHMALLRKYMDEKRAKVDVFLEEEWVPKFAENYFNQPNVSQVWNQVVASRDDSDRVKFITLVGSKLQNKINSERVKLIKPLDDLEKEIERKLRDEYRQAQAINNSITSYLSSAEKLSSNRDRLLNQVGIENNEIKQALFDADTAVSDLLEKKDSAEKKYTKFKEAIESVKNKLM